MQKHQEWLDNRSYEQHLECLKKIKARKNNSTNTSKKHRKHQLSTHQPPQNQDKQNRVSYLQPFKENRQFSPQQINPHFQTERKEFMRKKIQSKQSKNLKESQIGRDRLNCLSSRNPFNFTQNFFHKSRKSPNVQKLQGKDPAFISLKDQQLLWNNFLLGKRILQTSPVISKRKHDLEYQKHKQLVRSITTKKIHQNANFRLRKLQEHNDKIYKISDDHRIENNLHNQYMLNLVIQSVEFFKYKFSTFENILLVMKYGHQEPQNRPSHPQQKRTKQVSECIPSSILTSYNFFFTLKRKKFQQNVPIVIQMKNVKSLNVISIGTFSFQFDDQKQISTKEANLYNFGKLIGTVKFSVNFGRKNEFLSNIE